MSIITIDGPAGSGKSTVAKKLAKSLGFLYIDSGALYRAFAWGVLNSHIENISDYIKNFDIKYDYVDNMAKIWLFDKEITFDIRNEKISKESSFFASKSNVRERITLIQRRIASDNDVVVEGRDTGTVVFSNADFKFYITASLEERAKRRFLELKNNNKNISLEDIKKSIKQRDLQDKNRKYAPLLKSEDAIEVDTTAKTIDEVVDFLLKFMRNE
ncbi:(d)CMP kinase [bacterium]